MLAHPGEVHGIDEWKRVADTLNTANNTMIAHGLHAGYHNHDLEWKPVDGKKPIELLAANTDPSIMLQLDVGTCLEMGNDSVAWIKMNPGRIRSIHLQRLVPQGGIPRAFRGRRRGLDKDICRSREYRRDRVLLD